LDAAENLRLKIGGSKPELAALAAEPAELPRPAHGRNLNDPPARLGYAPTREMEFSQKSGLATSIPFRNKFAPTNFRPRPIACWRYGKERMALRFGFAIVAAPTYAAHE
jgi:hypothetical protein